MKKILFISLIVFSSISASSQNWMTDLEAWIVSGAIKFVMQ
ncbi:MAG: hypothetical protein ACKVIM_01075 [Flavobacteriales bacterium]|jgi:hypothetical protein|tara:strand:+ start:179 stop:301 length:123 start_codon:yes stop_codon:yes gene_type:complete